MIDIVYRIRNQFINSIQVAEHKKKRNLMLKPSRFASKKLPTNIYDINSINKFKLAERYLFSSTLFREEKFNFHIGIDLKQKSEILVATALANQCSLDKPNKSMEGFCSQIIWDQTKTLKKSKYKFKVFKKNGCLLEQVLTSIKRVQLKHLYYLFFLFVTQLLKQIELVSKINKAKSNIKSLNIKSLQLIQSIQRKEVAFQITNSACLQHKFIKSNSNQMQENQKILNNNNNQKCNQTRKTSMYMNQLNIKPSNKRDLEIVLEKIKEIQLDYKAFFENQAQRQQFHSFIKYCTLQNQKDVNKCRDSVIDWLNAVQRMASKNKINLLLVKQQLKIEINKIKSQNLAKVNLLCQQIQKITTIFECSQQSDFQIQQDEAHYQDIRKGEIVDLVEKHTFFVKAKKSNNNYTNLINQMMHDQDNF